MVRFSGREIPARAKRVVLLLTSALVALTFVACEDPPTLEDEPSEYIAPTLNVATPADDPASCVACHPRQYMEWNGSSHNYGNGLDGTYQALEITGNYFLANAVGNPLLRRNTLCITCHAPSAASFMVIDGKEGTLNANFSMGQAFAEDEANREIAKPAAVPIAEVLAGAAVNDLLPPPGRAVELAAGNFKSDVDSDERKVERAAFTFQGITCDSCHKVGAPLDGRDDPGVVAAAGGMDAEDQFEACLEATMGGLGDFIANGAGPPAACRRISNGQHPHHPSHPEEREFHDLGIANFAIQFERDGDVRYGPFPAEENGTTVPAVPAFAHNVSGGAIKKAPCADTYPAEYVSGPDADGMCEYDYGKYNIAVYPDGTPFEDQEPDTRPFLKTPQFCGACHDVRLLPALGNEPIHGEPFYRLENLYTEWFISPLNLYPSTQGDSDDVTEQFPDNPYRWDCDNDIHAPDDCKDGAARRIVCQDCHLALYPYAPPGVFPGKYTHPDDCDEAGGCGLQAATAGGRGNARIIRRDRVTTHNMTGPDIGLGLLTPIKDGIALLPDDPMGAVSLPNQADADEFARTIYEAKLGMTNGKGEVVDGVYQLPARLHDRRQRLLKTTVTSSLAGTPERIDPEEHCDENGNCTLSVKMWAMNVNGGHNVAAGFSQERQIWVELTVEDLGKPILDNDGRETGLYETVDCRPDLDPESIEVANARIQEIIDGGLDLDDFYEGAGLNDEGFPTRFPKTLTQDQAGVVLNLMTGMNPYTTASEDPSFHARICRGLSGHLMDKPHDETHEPFGDGLLDDEDIILHRIGNTLPTVLAGECNDEVSPATDQNLNGIPDGCETELLSWHVADVGFDFPERFCSNSELGLGKECSPGLEAELSRYPTGNLTETANFKARVARGDQFHVPGLNAFRADLTSSHLRAEPCDDPYVGLEDCHTARGWLGIADDVPMIDLPVQTRDGRNVSLREIGGAHPVMREAVVVTSDERLEMLYPFPEFPGLVPHGTHRGERFGLAYLTNIFYNLTGCGANGNYGDCEGPEEISFEWHGKTYDLHAQVPWPMTYPALPHILTYQDDHHYHHPLQGDYHGEEIKDHIEEYAYVSFMNALERYQDGQEDVGNAIQNGGTPYGESFTFIPFNSNHMPNNRSLKFYVPQRHYWDIRFNRDDIVGPIRVHTKVWYRHFPPEFLRLMARYTEGLYLRAVAEGKACKAEDLDNCDLPEEDNWFPHGPMVVEGEMNKLYPQAASIDSVRRVLLDESIMHVAVDDTQVTGGAVLDPPEKPSDDEVKFILDNHCNPCHSDVLRHGNLILDYDDYPRWDVAGGQSEDTVQNWADNVVGAPSLYGNGMSIVEPGNPEKSVLWKVLTEDRDSLRSAGITSRPMPLKFDRMSDSELGVIRRWIENL